MRVVLMLVLFLVPLSAADLVYARVMDDTEERIGWWDQDARVLYLKKGTYRWIKDPISVVHASAPEGSEKPAKRTFPKLPDLPYGKVQVSEEQVSLGWFHAPTGMLFVLAQDGTVDDVTLGVDKGAELVERLKAPVPMPTEAREYLDRWGIEHVDDIAP